MGLQGPVLRLQAEPTPFWGATESTHDLDTSNGNFYLSSWCWSPEASPACYIVHNESLTLPIGGKELGVWHTHDCIANGGGLDCRSLLFNALTWLGEHSSDQSADGHPAERGSSSASGLMSIYVPNAGDARYLSADSRSGSVQLGNALDALRFEQRCVPCPGRRLGVAGALLILALMLLAVVPMLVLMLCQRVRRRIDRGAPWPTRPRSTASMLIFQIGIAFTVLGATPWVLWTANQWWSGNAAPYGALTPIGITGTFMMLRTDDDAELVRLLLAISTLVVAGIVSSLAPNAYLKVTDTMSAPYIVGRDFEESPDGYRRFWVLAIYCPEAVVYGMTALVSGVWCLAQLRSLIRRRAMPTEWVLGRLWFSLRLTYILIGAAMLIGCLMSAIAIPALGNPNLPAERQLVASNIDTWLAISCCLLASAAVSRPRLRLALHTCGPFRLIRPLVGSPDVTRSGTPLDTLGTLDANLESIRWRGVDLSRFEDTDGHFERIKIGECIGVGGFSRVFNGSLDGENDVAVKVFTVQASRDAVQLTHLATELSILKDIRHPRIIELLGTLVLPQVGPAIVMRNLGGGTLHTLVTNRAAGAPPLTRRLQLQLAAEIAEGLACLHERCITHRDMKPSNVLLTSDCHAQICDFGVATRFGMEAQCAVGTMRFMAPEVLFGPYDHKADVYSYALVLWCILHPGRVPFAELTPINALMRIWQSNLRLEIALDPTLAKCSPLLSACSSRSAVERPSMDEVCAQLEGLKRTLVEEMSAQMLDEELDVPPGGGLPGGTSPVAAVEPRGTSQSAACMIEVV